MTDIYINAFKYAKTLIKWVFFACLVGVLGGFLGSLFHHCIDFVTELRGKKPWLVLFLPVGGIIITGMYAFFKNKGRIDTNRILESVSKDEKVPFVMTPLIFISTAITHLLGGSAGREGAALQLGGSIGYNIGNLFKLKKNDLHIIVMTGMSAVFAAVFGTPVTAAIFAIEVISVGTFHYAALFPCIISSLAGWQIANKLFQISPAIAFKVNQIEIDIDLLFKVGIVTAICAVVSALFCFVMRKTEHYAKVAVKGRYLRSFLGGIVIIILTMLVGTQEYNGAGMNIVWDAFWGNSKIWTFALKILFTAVTIAAGFKGGEIVPAFAIGSALGCVLGGFLGISTLGSAIGFIALFCGVTNCPVASLFLGIEVFGADNIMIFTIVCALSYVLSGYSGLYKSQKIVYSKLNDKYIDINAK